MTIRYGFAADTRVWVEYDDRSPLGGPLSPRLQDTMRQWTTAIAAAFRARGAAHVVEQGERLLGQVFRQPAFAKGRGGRVGRLPRRLVRVDRTSITPRELMMATGSGSAFGIDFASVPLRVLHDTVTSLAQGRFVMEGHARHLGEAMRSAGLIEEASPAPLSWRGVHATFLGHNAVVVRSGRHAVIVDPWLVPAPPAAHRYKPIPLASLGRIDAIAITHSHPDHFDPGSLLQFDRRTRIYVPRVPEESLLCADLAYRIRELGFESVHELKWGQTTSVGEIRLTALPFYGEQPTTGAQLFPDARNWGNCYLIRTPAFSCALVADSGRDRDGRVQDVAREAYLEWGPIDVLFSGYRGWSLYPIQFFESSVRQYLLFVPRELWAARQSIMNTVDEAIDTAELWHARHLVPYGDGGAPWYGALGLGPQFGDDGPIDDEWEGFDARPERVLQALLTRTMPVPGVKAASPVRGLLLRPGDSIRGRGTRVKTVRTPPYAWPWAEETR